MAPGVRSFNDYQYSKRDKKLSRPLVLTRPQPQSVAPTDTPRPQESVTTPARPLSPPARQPLGDITNRRLVLAATSEAVEKPVHTTGGSRHRSPSPRRTPVERVVRDGETRPLALAQPHGFRTAAAEGSQARMVGSVDGQLMPPIFDQPLNFDEEDDGEHQEDESFEDDDEDDEDDEEQGEQDVENLADLGEKLDGPCGGAIGALRPWNRERDGPLSLPLDPSSFEAADLGSYDASFPGTMNERARAVRDFEDDFRYTIKAAIKDAKKYSLKAIHDSRFCPQSWKLLTTMSEDDIFNFVKANTTEDRRAVLGSGVLSDKTFNALPRASKSELEGSIVYSTWTKRARQRFGYTSSGQSSLGGGDRPLDYEKARRWADVGVVQKATFGNTHLDTALHMDATLSIRIIMAFPSDTPKDLGVLCEGLFTDFLRTLEDSDRTTFGTGKVAHHTPEIMAACLAACAPRRRDVSFTGLNRSSPLRQGSGKCGGNIWYWDSVWGMSEEETRLCFKQDRQRRRAETFAAQGNCCTVCTLPFTEANLTSMAVHIRVRLCRLVHLKEHRNKYNCERCRRWHTKAISARRKALHIATWKRADASLLDEQTERKLVAVLYQRPVRKKTNPQAAPKPTSDNILRKWSRLENDCDDTTCCAGCDKAWATQPHAADSAPIDDGLYRLHELHSQIGKKTYAHDSIWVSAPRLFVYLPDLPTPPANTYYCGACARSITAAVAAHPERLLGAEQQQLMLQRMRLQRPCCTACGTTELGTPSKERSESGKAVHAARRAVKAALEDSEGIETPSKKRKRVKNARTWHDCMLLFPSLPEEWLNVVCHLCNVRGTDKKHELKEKHSGKSGEILWQREWLQYLRQRPWQEDQEESTETKRMRLDAPPRKKAT
ncbi:hypothetical protein LTR17_003319 [Elasticomyces elasticus]|nr:hypothetical protein LTR17_003319 [Elasticomyces elasticus]